MRPTLETLAAWMSDQRWYAGKDHSPVLELVDERELAPGVVLMLVAETAGAERVVYQVPLVDDAAGETTARVTGSDWVDGPRHPSFARALLAAVAPESADRFASARQLTGEQSNTSLVIELEGAPSVIAKVFRTLHDGDNPDVVLQSALSRAGSSSVPRFVGRLAAEWPDGETDGGRARGDLVFAQEFVAGSRDGWTLALDAAAAGRSFTDEAAALGRVTADVHDTLARVLPTQPADDAQIAIMTGSWHARLALALAAVPGLEASADRIRAVYDAARGAAWPPLQRVHGDLHLGQSLFEASRGWVLVDFEGEPLRPMRERDRPDSAVRDVAGMLRSFAYAEGAADAAPAGFAQGARAAFLDGYRSRAADPAGLLLDAFELDKAVYEALYEARNRPTWLPIPLAGIAAVLDRVESA